MKLRQFIGREIEKPKLPTCCSRFYVNEKPWKIIPCKWTGQFHVTSFDSETVTAAVSSAKGFYPAVDLHA